MPRTIDQQIAEAENRVQRLKAKKRTKDTRRKIIVGAVIISQAFQHKTIAEYLLATLEMELIRDVDKRDAQPLMNDLRKFIEKNKT
jgi:O-acetyl-ADP-ribose deacetylase (regulator of RNase III)